MENNNAATNNATNIIASPAYYTRWHRALRGAMQYTRAQRRAARAAIRAALGGAGRWTAVGQAACAAAVQADRW